MELNLKEKYFNLVKNGIKTIELRLFDEKRQRIKINDIIVIKNFVNNEKIKIIVLNLYKAKNFEELVQKFNIQKTGFKNIKELNESLLEFYTKEKQKQYGVLGIEFKLIN